MHPAPAKTPRNERLAKLAGCTVLGRELTFARAGLNSAVSAHRKAQANARKPYSAGGLTPVATRQHVRQAVARIRDIEARAEAKYGAQLPVTSAQPVAMKWAAE